MVELGHVVFYVKHLETSVIFYTQAVGLNLKGKIFNNRGAVLSGGRTHHELLLLEVGEAPGPVNGKRRGLYHVGWHIGDSLETLKKCKQRIESLGYCIKGLADHTISKSLYLFDPDGNEIELYIDDP